MHEITNIIELIGRGDITFTAYNEETQGEYTYQLIQNKMKGRWAVNVLTTPSKGTYTYIGTFTMHKGFEYSRKSFLASDCKMVIGAEWYLRRALANSLPPGVKTYMGREVLNRNKSLQNWLNQ